MSSVHDLLSAVRNHDVERVNALLKQGANPNCNAFQGDWSAPVIPLHIAASLNSTEMVKVLLKFNASVDIRNGRRSTALHCAARWGSSGVVEQLLSAGAAIDAKNGKGNTPLHSACFAGQTTCARILIKSGASVYQKNKHRKTARDKAVKHNNDDIVQLFDLLTLHGNGDDVRVLDNPPPINMRGRHIFVSYCHADKDVVFQIVDKLKVDGYSLWVDKEKMSGCLQEQIGNNIDMASIILIFFSSFYKLSSSCKKEACYGDGGGRVIIPVLVEDGYKANGWLGPVVGHLYYHDFGGKYKFDEKYTELTRAIDKALKDLRQSLT